MILSFAARLLCVAAVSAGLIHVVLEGLLWLTSPSIIRRSATLTARHRERLFYTLQLAPILAASTLSCAVCIPRYMRSEGNRQAESVGWLCIAGAVLIVAWFGCCLLRGLAAAARTQIFAQSCKRTSRPVSNLMSRVGSSTPILSDSGTAYGVALVGLIHPFILISDSLLGSAGLSHQAIDIVLVHEAAHAAQFDNWKLFSLLCLPSSGLRSRNGKTWLELWRNAAEWAADDDAIRGDMSRALVLAETLVAVARSGASQAQRVCMALECDRTDLVARVDRLIERVKEPVQPCSWSRLCGLAFGVAAVVGAGLGLLLSSHELLERLLHLGQA